MDQTPEGKELRPPEPSDRRADRAAEHRVWSYAAQLTSGMLANPTRGHFSIKDTISLFDEVLHELSSYAKLRGDLPGYANSAAAKQEPENFRAERPLVRRQVPLPGTAPEPGAANGYSQPEPQQPAAPRQPAPAGPPYGAGGAPYAGGPMQAPGATPPYQPPASGAHAPGYEHPQGER